MYAIFVNWMRTIVPLLVGWTLTVVGFLGVNPDSTATASLVTALLTGAYYTLFRIVEHVADKLNIQPLRVLAGVLLGWARPPQDPGTGLAPAGRTAHPTA
jgi:hypothetical protein